MSNQSSDWYVFKGNDEDGKIEVLGLKDGDLPPAPPWRPFGKDKDASSVNRRKKRGQTFQVREHEKEMINAALYLRRPLLITGNPGTGKSSLAYAVARQLELGEVLYWPITTRTVLKDGLYSYDAIARLQDVKEEQDKGIGAYIRLGPLGTALMPSNKPRVLIIDEIDKSDIDLPNDLLTVFEEGRFTIPELERLQVETEVGTGDTEIQVRTVYTDETEDTTKGDRQTMITNGVLSCTTFPFIVLTSNGERDFPAPFLRRCLRLTMQDPDKKMLRNIVKAHFQEQFGEGVIQNEVVKGMIEAFHKKIASKSQTLATDQLLNAIYMVINEKCNKQITTKEELDKRLKDNNDLLAKLMTDLGMVESDFE
ncbi:MAG: MoxR family ATPase [Limnothrix sp.]